MDTFQLSTPTKKSKPIVAVGLSGGVDSSVAALLLKQQGFEVIGLHMKNWDDGQTDSICTQAEDYQDVAHTASLLDIPFYGLNFVKEYSEQVFAETLQSFRMGFTPNPDILCNRHIKFKTFYDKALALGADYIATGHYCQTENGLLLKGKDPLKDQSYFLNAIHGETLFKTIFPIGNLYKAEVRKIAKANNLPTYQKKDSTGICFIGEKKFQPFLAQFINSKRGDFCQLNGKKVGTHLGSSFYTIGQRRHLGLGGDGPPWYVVKKDMEKNIVYVERDSTHPELMSQELEAENINWIHSPPHSFPFEAHAKIRYRQPDQACTIYKVSDKILKVIFSHAQRAVTPGQSIAFYQDNICLGGGTIVRCKTLLESGNNLARWS